MKITAKKVARLPCFGKFVFLTGSPEKNTLIDWQEIFGENALKAKKTENYKKLSMREPQIHEFRKTKQKKIRETINEDCLKSTKCGKMRETIVSEALRFLRAKKPGKLCESINEECLKSMKCEKNTSNHWFGILKGFRSSLTRGKKWWRITWKYQNSDGFDIWQLG